MNVQHISNKTRADALPLLNQGRVASDIHELADGSPHKFGTAQRTVDAASYSIDETIEAFAKVSKMSFSKRF